jgi:hypothetical protein
MTEDAEQFRRERRRHFRELVLAQVIAGLIVAAIVYVFTRRVEPHLDERFRGVPDDFATVAEAAFAARPEPFAAGSEEDHSRSNVRLWEAVRQVSSPRKPLGRDHPAGPQETGDCVAWGLATALAHTGAVQALAAGRTTVDDPFQPFLYGLTRTLHGRPSPPCGQAGAYPTTAAEAFECCGWVSYREAGFNYSGRLADEWGCTGPPAALRELAKSRGGGSWYPIRSLEEWQNAICSGFATTVAIPWAPGRIVVKDGRQCITSWGRGGGHQVACVGFDGSTGRRYWCLFNSHGAGWPAGHPPLQGEPPGTCWTDEAGARWILENGVVIAISSVPGFKPVDLNWDAFQ